MIPDKQLTGRQKLRAVYGKKADRQLINAAIRGEEVFGGELLDLLERVHKLTATGKHSPDFVDLVENTVRHLVAVRNLLEDRVRARYGWPREDKNMEILKTENKGRHIESTNYYSTEQNRRGIVSVSLNDKTFRLLIPARMQHGATDKETVVEMTRNVKHVIAARGVPFTTPIIRFIFDDGSQSPYMLDVDCRVFDVLPSQSDHGREDLSCIGYVHDPDGGIKEAFDLPCKFRWGENAPDVSAWR